MLIVLPKRNEVDSLLNFIADHALFQLMSPYKSKVKVEVGIIRLFSLQLLND